MSMCERFTWEELVSRFPERWVVLKETEKEGPDIISGILVDVKTDDEIISYENENLKIGYAYWRTTEGGFYGVIDSDISISLN